ncbi:MAG TPA: hypothetical protein ENN60_00390 [archaeon]|nr:hypothetical protein [archaeon]
MVGSWTVEYHKEPVGVSKIFPDVSQARVIAQSRFLEVIGSKIKEGKTYSTVVAGIQKIRKEGGEDARGKNYFVLVASSGQKRFELLFEIMEGENCHLIGANVPEIDPTTLKSIIEGIATGKTFQTVRLLI